MKKTTLLFMTLLGGASLLSAKTWTSADGGKTFEAEYISHTDTDVTVMKGFKKMTFELSLLSDADKKWISEEAGKEVTAVEEVATGEPGKIGEKVAKYLKKFDGRRYATHKLTKTPEYYLVYFSASW